MKQLEGTFRCQICGGTIYSKFIDPNWDLTHSLPACSRFKNLANLDEAMDFFEKTVQAIPAENQRKGGKA